MSAGNPHSDTYTSSPSPGTPRMLGSALPEDIAGVGSRKNATLR